MTDKSRTKTIAIAGSLFAAVLAVSIVVASTTPRVQTAEAREYAIVKNPYFSYLTEVYATYKAVEDDTWQYDLYTTVDKNTVNFKNWFCLDDNSNM